MTTYELKTKKNDGDVDAFIMGVEDAQKRSDSLEIIRLMEEATGQSPKMWGKSIVGFGTYHYKGKTSEGEWMVVGFSPRKQNLTLYLACDLDVLNDLLENLGKHSRGVGCLYLKSLADVDLGVLKELIVRAYDITKSMSA
jgi:hypothetical protein